MSPGRLIWVAAAIVWASFVVTIGPKIGEVIVAKLWPPVTGLELIELARDAETISFQIVGAKLTNDVLSTITAAWSFPDNTIMPIALNAVDGLGGPVAIRTHGDFVSRTYSVRDTPAATTVIGTMLRLCLVYPAVGIYCLETPYTAFPTP